MSAAVQGESLLRVMGFSNLSSRDGQERGGHMFIPKTWNRSKKFSTEAPGAVATMLSVHPDLADLGTTEAKAKRLARLIGCSTGTARGLLAGDGSGRRHYVIIIEECGGMAVFWDLCVALQERAA
ncbi:MAG: hypothetical protein AAFU49_23780 [Pseudomonadota bacterium]